MKRPLLILCCTCLILIGVLGYRTLVVQQADYLHILPQDIVLDSNLGQVARNLAGAIQIATISSRPGEDGHAKPFRAFQRYLLKTYPRLHTHLDRRLINQLSLLYHWKGSDPTLPPILLTAHYDTVPVALNSEQRWSHPPFSGAIADGYIWGRGSLDDKGMIIAQMETIEHLLASGGHSSMPPQHTAAGRIGQAVTRLEHSQMPASLSHSREFFDSILAFLPFGQRVLVANSWLFAPLLLSQMERQPQLSAALRTTTAVTMLSGSPKENVLPTEASAVINFRIMPGETTDDVMEHVTQVIDDADIEITPTGAGLNPSPVAPLNGSAYALLERTARETWLDDSLLVAPKLVPAATDTRHYHELSDQVFRFMPAAFQFEDIQGIHGTNERLSLANLETMLRFYHQLIMNAN